MNMKRDLLLSAIFGTTVTSLVLFAFSSVDSYTVHIDKEVAEKESAKIRAACLPAPGQTSRMKWQDGKLMCEIAQVGYGVYKPVKMVYIAEIDKN